jgi:signal transduction histidine kinase
MNIGTIDITLFLFVTTSIIILLAILIVSFVFVYQKNQYLHAQMLSSLKIEHEHRLTSAQLEIQESTCQSISREIHDNINHSLTLAKLHLNTFDWIDQNKGSQQLESSIEIISKVITDLSDISKSLKSEMVEGLGLISAIEYEIDRIRATNIFEIDVEVTGEHVILENKNELLIFRIIQEAFNNIIKHANAKSVRFQLHYSVDQVFLRIIDDGCGCDPLVESKMGRSGLENMPLRSKMLNGSMTVNSKKNVGTILIIKIPLKV